jgi:hypothetical protein
MHKLITKRAFTLALSAAAIAALTACGGGSDTTSAATTTLSVTPVLGAVYGGTVNMYSSTGTLLGTGTTSTTDGKASVTLSGYTPGTPVVIKVTLTAGSYYFNEKTGTNVTVSTPVSLLSALPAVGSGQAVGVTPITNMAAKLAGLSASTVGTGPISVTSDAIYTAVAKANLVLGLPASTNILAAPTAATLAAPKPTETMGNILAVMAKNTTSSDPIAQANALADAVKTDGTVDTTKTAAITEVNTTLKNPTLATGVTITIAASNPAPTAAELTTATTAAKTVVDAAKATGAGG